MDYLKIMEVKRQYNQMNEYAFNVALELITTGIVREDIRIIMGVSRSTMYRCRKKLADGVPVEKKGRKRKWCVQDKTNVF